MTTEKNINDFKEIKIFEAALKNTKEMGITIKENPNEEKSDNDSIKKQIKNLNRNAKIFKKSLNKLAENNPDFEKQLNLAKIFNKLSNDEISKVLKVLVKTSDEILNQKENINKEIIIRKSELPTP